MSITRKQQAGLTLVELIIGLLVGTIIIAGGLRVFTVVIRGQSDNVKLTRLNQDMRAMMDIMVRDIRRAGFVTSDPENNLSSLKNNPFFDAITPGATTDIAVHDTGRCLVYSYNKDDGSPPAVGSVPINERFGFMLSGVLLKMRRYGATNENCNTGLEWESISEPEVEITVLDFTLTENPLNVTSMTTDTDGDGCYDGDDATPLIPNPTTCQSNLYGNNLCDTGVVIEACNTCSSPDTCLYVRQVTITLTGRLRSDNTVTQTITQGVRVRNDKFVL